MKKFFCKTKIVLIILILTISIGTMTKVEAADKTYTENIIMKLVTKLKNTKLPWSIYEIKDAIQDIDKNKEEDLPENLPEKLPENLPEKIYTQNIEVGNKLKFTGVAWSMYETKDAALNTDKDKKLNEYITNGKIVEVKEKTGNVLKIGDGKYIYYGPSASNYFELVKEEDLSQQTSQQPNNPGQQTGNIFTDSRGRKFKLYKQNGPEYNYVKYPGRGSAATIGKNGCGPVSCTIISSGYGYNDTPKTLVQTGKNYSGYQAIINYFKNKGFTVEFKYSMNNNEVIGKLKQGYKIVVLSQKGRVGCYNLGQYSHWYTLLEYNTNSGKVFVGDPLTARRRMV